MVVATMEASSSLCLSPFLLTVGSRPQKTKSTASFVSQRRKCNSLMIRNRRRFRTPTALGEFADTVAESGKAEITWQIIVGTIAGITPFVVAGVEFSKRIIAQKRCGECGGTGLVVIEKEYIRCPECGNFDICQSKRNQTRRSFVFCFTGFFDVISVFLQVGFCHGSHGEDSLQGDILSNII